MSRELYLIDGYSVIYRGYFAFLRKPLLNPQGRNSSAVFVFFRTLFQVVRERAPGLIAVAMDSRVPTFRHERYEQYKANREKAPEDLHAQVPVIEEILAALGVPSVRADGYEADDVIATLAEGCRGTGLPCWILSGDKDIMQLIGGNTRLLAPERGATDIVEYAREKVFEVKGVYPEQIIDFLALTGDSSDNVPGVPGIGEKTAQKLLSQFGGLDAVYAKLDAVTPDSLRKKLEAGRDSAFLSRELVTLRRDVPDLPGVNDLAFKGFNAEAAIPLFEREGMKSLASELGGTRPSPDRSARTGVDKDGAAPSVTPVPPVELKSTLPGTYTTVTTLSELDAWLGRARQAGTYAFDVETDNLDEMLAVPLGFSLSIEEGTACYVPLRAAGVSCIPEQDAREHLAKLLEDAQVRLVGQNSKYDYKVMRRWGVRPANVHFDTMLAAWMLESDEGIYGMDRLAERRLGFRTKPYDEVVGKGQTLEQVPIQQVTDYSGEDAD
ncbi:MAG: 5'-3' exonuclease H3TH domain-containing protein, partial [Spirochaetia bacterium]